MTQRFGANYSTFQDSAVPLTSDNGIPLINTSTEFGSSPLGNALREQIQFGLPNASFNLLPRDPYSAIVEGENELPFWQIQTTDNITATPTFDSTTQTWGIKVDPGTAPSGDYLTLTTRSWVTTDDNLSLRQKASLTLAKGGTYAGATQWNLTLTAIYYDSTNTGIATAVIGTVYDNTTWTSISGTTTTGGSAIPASASWAEFTIKLTATANVTSSTFVTLQSLLLATSSPAGVFVVTDTFSASGTWTRPTGVNNLIAVVGVGGGGGGGGGGGTIERLNSGTSPFGGAGGSSSWVIVKDIYIGNITSVTVGVGTAGVGGVGGTATKPTAGTVTSYAGTGAVGGAGGASSFGTYLSIPGGGGGSSGGVGTAAGTPSPAYVFLNRLGAVASVASSGGTGNAGSAATYGQLPYWAQVFSAGGAGGTGTFTATAGAGSAKAGAAGSASDAGIIGSGGNGGEARGGGSNTNWAGDPGGKGGNGAGSGGAGIGVQYTSGGTPTFTVTGGAGGTAASNSGSGGGGGGGAYYNNVASLTAYNAGGGTATGGKGGDGAAGLIYVVYVA